MKKVTLKELRLSAYHVTIDAMRRAYHRAASREADLVADGANYREMLRRIELEKAKEHLKNCDMKGCPKGERE